MELINRIRKSRKGFTLVEIIVVLVILAVLAAFTIPTMLGFVEEARGKALIAEARMVYVAAQATATEYNAGPAASKPTGDLLSSKSCFATTATTGGVTTTTLPTDASSLAMYNYLKDDLTISTNATDTKPTKAATGTGSIDNAYWIVTLDEATGGNPSKVTKVEYSRNGYTVTIDKSSTGSAIIQKYI